MAALSARFLLRALQSKRSSQSRHCSLQNLLPSLAHQTNTYCREEEASNCPSTCLTCLARGGVCEIGCKIQHPFLPTLATDYFSRFSSLQKIHNFQVLGSETAFKNWHRKAPLITSSSGVRDPACSCKTHLEKLLTKTNNRTNSSSFLNW